MLLEGVNYGKMLMEYYKKPGDTQPPAPMPTVKTNLARFPITKLCSFGSDILPICCALMDLISWLILFSAVTSPFTFFGKAFAGADAMVLKKCRTLIYS
jgi:hypothetical protein